MKYIEFGGTLNECIRKLQNSGFIDFGDHNRRTRITVKIYDNE